MIETHTSSPQNPMKTGDAIATGRFTQIDGESFYSIRDYDRLPAFLMSVVSDSDHWLYVSSNGGLTAGRANPDQSLFPYDSEDKIHQCHDHTGPRTGIWVSRDERDAVLWEPFRESAKDNFTVRRHLYKSVLGNTLIFEEVNDDLGLTFRYRWRFSEKFGTVRVATLANAGDTKVSAHIIDGLLNVMPWGISPVIHQQRHCLADAYKHCEVDSETGLGIYSLSSMILDRAEPGEMMRATTVWSTGLPDAQIILNPAQLSAFRSRRKVYGETLLKGRKGAYLLSSSLCLDPGQMHRWKIVAEVSQTQSQVAWTRKRLLAGDDIDGELMADCRLGNENLLRNLACADGLQQTGNQTIAAHHLANVLFNNMRGGIFDKNYDVGRDDLSEFIQSRNTTVAKQQSSFLDGLPEVAPIQNILELTVKQNDPDLTRLCYEYLPIHFSRRHGDPSRPWNFFDIRLRDDEGNRVLSYQGNWRDIFQNWEALCMSFPGFLPSVIAKFVNASTADGFNPYRITREGIDWEVVEPDDQWSNIGYWGDHQIIYLLKLLEALDGCNPNKLSSMLVSEIFSYADVPYSIKPYEELLADPRDTIVYDTVRSDRVEERVRNIGADGRLLVDSSGEVHHINLTEKLLVPALSKLCNLVLDGGIWLNTQRPEWNDANNALVGNGLSVVTLGYLRRYLVFAGRIFDGLPQEGVSITDDVASWLTDVHNALDSHRKLLNNDQVCDTDRKLLLDTLGGVFCDYRRKLYADGLGGKSLMSCATIKNLLDLSLQFVDHSLRANRRPDGMYHAYNLLELSHDGDAAGVMNLPVMLEGQVAALSSGLLTSEDSLTLLDSLASSPLYRPDQDSYILYPDRELPGFLAKNIIPADLVESCELLKILIDDGDTRIVMRDAAGDYRFNPAFYNTGQLGEELGRLREDAKWCALIDRDSKRVGEIYEEVFSHKAFTGRSGAMYGYEGLGCIYWHMISKLLLATQECYQRAFEADENESTRNALAESYYRVRFGIGFNKTPAEYGAFPTDPYSHTPGFAGARQPGMTGQVKEEILTRLGELGVNIEHGRVGFAPTILEPSEFLKVDDQFRYFDITGSERAVDLMEGSLAFTFCQVPVVYHLGSAGPRATVTRRDGQTEILEGSLLSEEISRSVFSRTGEVTRIDVTLPSPTVQQADNNGV
jgi:hypothetical protein